ncbi:MAG TPA: SBBP repeat-containing protein [Bacteroidales bacterium]|nr:SBBP repeat-containing protein [Bacteroidales bacterium]
MKTLFISSLLCIAFSFGVFSQKTDFSGILASGAGVHTSTPSVVDKDGNIFIAGGTREGLKITGDAFQKSYSGHTKDDMTGGDAFLMKLSPAGELIYSTYIGGSGSEYYCLQITLDDSGNVYVGFTTDSKDLPVSDNAFQKSLKGENDHYIIKFSNACKYLSSTYLGGSGGDHWTRLAANNNNLYLFGKTKSFDFPTSPKAVQKEYDYSVPPDSNNIYIVGDITITALSSDLDKVLYSTYLGGNSMDFIKSCSFGRDGELIIAGQTFSENFPVTKNAYQKSKAGKEDGFLTILNQKLSDIIYCTYIGGDSTDVVNYAFLDDADNIILAGETKSPDFPVTSKVISNSYAGGNSDGFITKFNLKSNKPEYSSFLGGSRTDQLRYVAKTESQQYVLVGTSSSKNFPVTEDALDQSIEAGLDLVILILDSSLKTIEYSTFGGGSKQRIMDPTVNFLKEGKLIITSMCVAPDFPLTLKYAEPDKTWMNCILKFDLTNK